MTSLSSPSMVAGPIPIAEILLISLPNRTGRTGLHRPTARSNQASRQASADPRSMTYNRLFDAAAASHVAAADSRRLSGIGSQFSH
ncbi:hypothetical protein IEQ34_003764 [Dendrobium chrysotoxum]|uniref:Uncharacterized protein n=1 Tax=Dendrobium chrysotoxum TaxID=161865 RepID=A0AAV7HC97_DENCH|nr:hypothetical protein IEQ34_003764 [Dendrobium chrysotoxum]